MRIQSSPSSRTLEALPALGAKDLKGVRDKLQLPEELRAMDLMPELEFTRTRWFTGRANVKNSFARKTLDQCLWRL